MSAAHVAEHAAHPGRQEGSVAAGLQGEKQCQVKSLHLAPEAICLERKDNITELLSPFSLQG